MLVVDDRSDPPASEALGDIETPPLRVIPSHFPPGASGARNSGIEKARHDVLVFVDDDDLMVEDYPTRVVAAASGPVHVDFGIANGHRLDTQTGRTEREEIPLTLGVIPVGTPLRRTLVSAGRGFWARRQVLTAVGAFDIGSQLDEDTALAVRLRLGGFVGHFEPEPGVITRLNAAQGSAQAQQVTQSQAELQYDAYRTTYETYAHRFGAFSGERWFLLTRFLRRAAKAGRSKDAARIALRHRPRLVALGALIYLGLKTMKHRRTS